MFYYDKFKIERTGDGWYEVYVILDDGRLAKHNKRFQNLKDARKLVELLTALASFNEKMLDKEEK